MLKAGDLPRTQPLEPCLGEPRQSSRKCVAQGGRISLGYVHPGPICLDVGNRISLFVIQRNGRHLEVLWGDCQRNASREGKLCLQENFPNKVWYAPFGQQPIDLSLHLRQAFLLRCCSSRHCSDIGPTLGLLLTLYPSGIQPSEQVGALL